MPNLEHLCVVPSNKYFHSHLSGAALNILLKFSRLTYLDIGHADAPKIATLQATLTQLQCIDSAAYRPDVTGVNPSKLAHLTLDHDLIRKLPLNSFTNLRRVSLEYSGELNVAQLFSEPLATVTQLALHGRSHTRETPQQFPNLASIFPNLASISFGNAQLSTDQSLLHDLTRLTAVNAIAILPNQLQGVKLRSLSSHVEDIGQFSEYTRLTALSVTLAINHPSLVNLTPLAQLERLKLTNSGKDKQFSVGSRLTRVTLIGEHSTPPWTAFTHLQRLTLDYVPIYTARVLRVLTQLTRLTFKRCISLDHTSLQWLASLPEISDLTLQGATDAGVQSLTSCSALTALRLMNGTVSGASVNQLHQLRRLVLSQVVLSGDYLSQLYHLEQLKRVFDTPPESFDVLAIQAACSNNSLTALVLNGALLDEHATHALTQLTQLKYLQISWCLFLRLLLSPAAPNTRIRWKCGA